MLFSLLSTAQEKDDVNTPLHLLPANYPTPYKAPDKVMVKGVLDRVFNYINQNTPPELLDTLTGKKVDVSASITPNVVLKKGVFRITSYEWGVVYSALLNAYKSTGDKNYVKYVKDRHEFIAHWAGVFRDKLNKGEMTLNADFPLRQPVAPHALDDGGAVAASMIKAEMLGLASGLNGQINHLPGVCFQKGVQVP